MKLDALHLCTASSQNLHIFWIKGYSSDLGDLVQEIGDSCGLHVAIIDASGITNQVDLLLALAYAYDFPRYSGPNYENLAWSSVDDFMGDLNWLRDKGYRGFILLFLNPMPLFYSDTTEFAILLNGLGIRSQSLIDADIPFHVVFGPVDYKALQLISCLSVASQSCAECWSD